MSPSETLQAIANDLDDDALLDRFIAYTNAKGIDLYEAQEEAILELLSGNNVILKTPTGSGKSLVAAAGHFICLAKQGRSFYTAPIKALVSEKFFSLRKEFGDDQVGMVTGDSSVNPEAPIICCTAEILANQALREGALTDADLVIMDEFHYYSDPQRGWAWQIPLLELQKAQFLLLSATLGDTTFFEKDLTARTKRITTLVHSDIRPVPLEFEYRRTTLHTSITDLLEKERTPIYLVHFTQREATEAAQNYLSLNPLSKAEKQEIKKQIAGFKFDSPIGKDLRRYISGGVGIHHAGLLPKYRLLIEKLAQGGLLKIICGTDTLGVGVNVPIKSVLFTQLFKYDGTSTRTLSNREFHQIAGRAGRKGFDDKGYVWIQDPPHVVENALAAQKSQAEQKKKKIVKKKAPERGYAHWTEATFKKLVQGEPEALRSSFHISHQMILQVLDRPGDGCRDLRNILTDNHETPRRQRKHIKRAIKIYRSLQEAELLENLEDPDDLGRSVRVALDLQNEFALHQPLSLWGVKAIEELDPEAPDYSLLVLSVIEAILESPGVILSAQTNHEKQELLAALKARGVEYEERMERLEKVEHPKPNKEWIYQSFDAFRSHHPWVGSDTVRPKGIVRDLYENAMGFNEFIYHYKMKRFEGVVLRYLSHTYKALQQNVPETRRTAELEDLIEWLGVIVRQVDSSLIDEWDQLNKESPSKATAVETAPQEQNITTNKRAFRVMVRNQVFQWVQLLAHKQYQKLPQTAEIGYEETMSLYWDEFETIAIDAEARSADYFNYDGETGQVTQILLDESSSCSWRIQAQVDFNKSIEIDKAVVEIESIYSL